MEITQSAFDAIVAQARAELPDEACGYLLGHGETAERHYAMTNVDHSPEHFAFDPAEQFNALRYARKQNLRIVGNWHSHPASPARPSQEDIRLANDPNINYLILSLAEAEPVLNAFRIRKGQPEKIPLDIIPA